MSDLSLVTAFSVCQGCVVFFDLSALCSRI